MRAFGALSHLSRTFREIENIEASNMEECLQEVPPEWCGDGPERISQLAEQLYQRRRRVRQLIVEAKQSSLRPFPNWD